MEIRAGWHHLALACCDRCGIYRRHHLEEEAIGRREGSTSEVEYVVLPARDLDYLTESKYAALEEQVREARRMLTGLNQRLRSHT